MIITKKFAARYINGFPLIFPEALTSDKNLPAAGTIVEFADVNRKFICKGYIGKQNKGLGWMLSNDRAQKINSDFFYTKLATAWESRQSFRVDPATDCYRIFNGEGDGIGGFTIDNYNNNFLINWYNDGIYKFKDEIISCLDKLASPKSIYQKKRFLKSGKYLEETSFVKGTKAPDSLIVKENGVKFAIHLEDGAMVGVFLDQREVRQKILKKYSAGKSVLNTFSYTGAFSVFAALGGAASTVSVDLAKRSLAKTREHFSINNIDLASHTIIVEDIFHYFQYAVRKDLKFDLVILDPPSFARSKKYRFSAAKDYPALIKKAIAVTAKKGCIVAATNCATFDMEKFKNFIAAGFDNISYDVVEEFQLPTDFKTIQQFAEGNYLKVVIVRMK